MIGIAPAVGYCTVFWTRGIGICLVPQPSMNDVGLERVGKIRRWMQYENADLGFRIDGGVCIRREGFFHVAEECF